MTHTKLFAALFSVLLVFGAMAGEGDEKKKTEKKQDVAPAAAGMVYTTQEARGPNGELPTELREALSEMVNTSSEGLTEVQLEDGTVMVDLKGRFQSAMVVSIGEDGKLKSGCYSSVPGHTCKEHKSEAKANQTLEKAPPKNP